MSINNSGSQLARTGSQQPAVVDRRTGRELTKVEREALVRVANVRAESYVQTEKIQELDHLAREAMTGQAMLHQWSATLSQNDPFVADDLKLFVDVAKMGKAEIIADTVTNFCRESR